MNINIDEVGELLNKPRIFFQELLNEVEKKYKGVDKEELLDEIQSWGMHCEPQGRTENRCLRRVVEVAKFLEDSQYNDYDHSTVCKIMNDLAEEIGRVFWENK